MVFCLASVCVFKLSSTTGSNLRSILSPYGVEARDFVRYSDLQLRYLRKRVLSFSLYDYRAGFARDLLGVIDSGHPDSDIFSCLLEYVCCD
jgi:hypothetical protein